VRSKFRIVFGLSLGVVLSALLLEALLWLLPTFNGVFAADPNAAWPVAHGIPGEYTYSTRWNFRIVRHGVINEMGYAAPFDYRTDRAFAALFGDSYMEALMIRYEDSIAGQLASSSLSSPSRVLNFGSSGSALPDYLGVGSLVRDRFHPEWVIVSIGDGDFVEGFTAGPGHFRWNADDDPRSISLVPVEARSQAAKIIRHSALVRYVRSNLRLTIRGVLQAEPPVASDSFEAPCNDERLNGGDTERIKKYVEHLPDAFGVPTGRIILLRDSETLRQGLYARQPVDRHKNCSPSRDEQALQLLTDLARSAGMSVVDTFPLFRSHFETTGERVDFSPTDWHWNETGHKIAAAAIHDLIVSKEAP
jgi:hypothetical protein